jgi:hypothetical protein
MLRRLYLMFPQPKDAKAAVEDLNRMGVVNRFIHTIAREGVDTSGLPEATVRQRSDKLAQIETLLWDLNLGLFFALLAVLVISLFAQAWSWALGSGWLMIASFMASSYYASHVPHTHLDECRVALNNGEVLLLVDVPHWRVHQIEKFLADNHPELVIGGVGWSLDMLQL